MAIVTTSFKAEYFFYHNQFTPHTSELTLLNEITEQLNAHYNNQTNQPQPEFNRDNTWVEFEDNGKDIWIHIRLEIDDQYPISEGDIWPILIGE